MDVLANSLLMLKVGELAKRTGKTVRAIHLYEELGLLHPARSKGGYRLYPARAVTRIEWITKLQEMGLSLTEIKAFLRVWEESGTGPEAMSNVRSIFEDKLKRTRETLARLTQLEADLQDSLTYLESCRACEPEHTQHECGCCGRHGHDGKAPLLVDGITKH